MKFINPYNFIPMGNQRTIAGETTKKKLLSGVITYSVLTKTPLFIPNTSCDTVYGGPKDHKSYQFYSYIDYSIDQNREQIENPEPVIPGSEIRGMFRSNFEILTNSCMSALDSDMKLSKRTMESYHAGLLKRISDCGKVHYDLYGAVDVLWRTSGENNTEDDLNWENDEEHRSRKCYIQNGFAEGERVNFILKRREKNGKEIKPLASSVCICKKGETAKNNEGYMIKGEKSPSGRTEKHCCHIFKLKNKALVKEDIKITLLDDLLHIYAENKLNNASLYEEYRREYERYKEGDGNEYFPVYYCEIKDCSDKRKKKVFLAPACKTREIYDTTLRQLAGDLAPCTGENGFCEACELFGTITQKETKSSKIRFTDLRVEKKENKKEYYLKKPITLPELSSPKLNNMEFYLKRPENRNGKEPWFWTYDYFVDASGELHIEQGRLSGRKFYWHQKLDNSYNPQEEQNERNVTIKPAVTGLVFHGKIYFEKITKETLDKLIYLINAGEACNKIEEKEHGYKLGMGKPLGLGSIACVVNEVKIKSYEIKDGRAEREEQSYEYDLPKIRKQFKTFVETDLIQNFDKIDLIQNFDKMTGFHSVVLEEKEEYFSYPKTRKEAKGYEWFTKNHKGINRKQGNRIIGMPGARKDMIFLEYMKAMEPRVKSVRCQEEGKASETNNRENSHHKTEKKREQQKKSDSPIEIGIVQPYKKLNVIKFKIGQRKSESIQCAKSGISPDEVQTKYPEGSQIKVRFKGTTSSGFKEYEIIKE